MKMGPRTFIPRAAAPYLVLAVTLGATITAWWLTFSELQRRDARRFEANVETVRRALFARLDSDVSLLKAAAAFVEATPRLPVDEFRHFARRTLEGPERQGLVGIGYARRTAASEQSRLVAYLRQAFPAFTIRPAAPTAEVTPLLYLEPLQGNEPAIGFNLAADPVRREALRRAADTGTAAVTAPLRLAMDAEPRGTSFLIVFPVYRDDPNTVEERRRKLRGFTLCPIRATELFTGVFGGLLPAGLAVEVVDADPSGTARLFPEAPTETGVPSAHSRTTRESVLGRDWRLRFSSTPAFQEQSGTSLSFTILPVGAGLSLLLFGLSFAQARVQREIEAVANDLARSESRQRLLAQAGKLLGESLDLDRTLGNVAQLAVPTFADWCAVNLVAEDALRRVAVAHVNPDKVQWANELERRYPPDEESPHGVFEVIRTGKSQLIKTVPEEMLLAAARDEEHMRLIRELQLCSAIVVPMKARDRVLGAITFVWAESRRFYDENDLELAEELAQRAAVAVDSARLFQQAREDLRERTRVEGEIMRLNHNLERMVRDRTHELEAANQELEAFCYSVSHDLRTPLRSVDGFSKALLDDYGEAIGDEGREHVRRVRAASRRMDELITALLTLSRLTRAELTLADVDVSQMASEIAAEHARTRERTQLSVQAGMRAHADPKTLRVVLDNLIGNAFKFSEPVASPRVEVGQDESGTFFVQDNGVGFNPQYAAKLFQPFERLHSEREFPGSGIGLATVHRIIQRHGGRVWAESQPGQGAKFMFTLAES